MSMSLQYMEMGRGYQHPGSRSIFRPARPNVAVVASVLVGQLVGSSGGVLFLAEFVVTAVSLVLGGAATVSANAVESWACFSCLSATAFFGYLFARVGLMDGMRRRRRGTPPSLYLCASLLLVSALWILAVLPWVWEFPSTTMIVRNLGTRRRANAVRDISELLQ